MARQPAAAPVRAARPAADAGGMASPIARPATGLRAGDWNTIEVVLDANILRPFLNDAGGVTGGVADEDFGRFGAVALYVGGTGEVRFKDVAYKDLQPRVAARKRSPAGSGCRRSTSSITPGARASPTSIATARPDIVAGPYYYLGPDYSVAREIYVARTIDPGTQYFNGLQFAYDFTGDGWPDVINVALHAADTSSTSIRKGSRGAGTSIPSPIASAASSAC